MYFFVQIKLTSAYYVRKKHHPCIWLNSKDQPITQLSKVNLNTVMIFAFENQQQELEVRLT